MNEVLIVPKPRVLEIGSGNGRITFRFATAVLVEAGDVEGGVHAR